MKKIRQACSEGGSGTRSGLFSAETAPPTKNQTLVDSPKQNLTNNVEPATRKARFSFWNGYFTVSLIPHKCIMSCHIRLEVNVPEGGITCQT